MTDPHTQTTIAAIRAFQAMSAFDKWTSWAFSRALVEHPTWYVPVDADGQPLRDDHGFHQYITAFTDPAISALAGVSHNVISGRALHIAALADGVSGVVLDRGEAHEQLIDAVASADSLRYWHDIAGVEEALHAPDLGQADRFLALGWIVGTHDGVIAVDHYAGLRTVHVFTAPDESSRFNATPALDEIFAADPNADARRLAIVPGHRLWTSIAANNGVDAVLINRGLDNETWLGPQFAQLLLQGIDDRPCARVLPARTIAEIHLFLDLAGVTSASREHQLEYAGEQLVARYSGETRDGDLRSYWFEPVMPHADPLDLGAGASAILCGAALADLLGRLLNYLDSGNADRAAAETALRWADELLKMMPDGLSVLPREAVRSINGARVLREAPEIVTRVWIEAAREMAQRLASSD